MLNRYLLEKSRSERGFTVIEILVVVVMAGVLAAIAAPGWLRFVHSRRAATAQDQIVQALRVNQNEAIRVRRSQTLEFNPDAADPPEIRYGRTADDPGDRFTEIIGNGVFDPTMIALETRDANGDAVPEIVMDEQGNLASNLDLPITIVVQAPADGNGPMRCVMVETLLGATREGKNEECEP